MFFKKKRKTGIRFIKIYDGIRMNDEVVSAPPKETIKTLEHIKQYPKRYAFNARKEDRLLNIPNIKIAELVTPEPLPGTNIDIIAEVTFTSISPTPVNRTGPFAKLAIFLTIWSIFGGIFLIFVLNKEAERTAIDAQCYYYFKNGTPTHVIVEGHEYQLDEDGKLDLIEKTFFNPWHRTVLANNQCIEIYR